MRKISTIFTVALLCYFTISCNETDLNPTLIKAESSNLLTIKFQGETVVLQDGLTAESFEKYLKFRKLVEKGTEEKINTSDFKKDLSKISSSEIFEIIKNGIALYPFTQEDFSEEQIAKIKKDIPSIKDKEDAQKKKSIISDYYNLLLIKHLEKEIDKKKNAKVLAISPDNTNELEKQLALQDPLAAYCFGDIAKSECQTMTTEVFGCYLPDSKQLNAFKHSSWNAIGVQELVQYSRNKWTSLDRIKTFACAHEHVEVNGQWILPDDGSVAMDLHNNLAGRTYMYNQITTFLGVAGNIPSDGQIKNHLAGLTYSKKNSASEIMQMSSSYNYYDLGHIYNAMNYHTPTSGILVYIQDGMNPYQTPYDCTN